MEILKYERLGAQNKSRAKSTRVSRIVFLSHLQWADGWKAYFKEYWPDIEIDFFEFTTPEELRLYDCKELIKQYAKNVLGVFDKNNIPQDVPILGHRFGGKVALYLNKEYDIGSKLVLFGTRVFRRRFLRSFLRDLLGMQSQNGNQNIWKMLVDCDFSWLAEGINIPVLLLWGDRDTSRPLVDAVELSRILPHSMLRIIVDGTAHAPYKPVPEALREIIFDFIANVSSS